MFVHVEYRKNRNTENYLSKSKKTSIRISRKNPENSILSAEVYYPNFFQGHEDCSFYVFWHVCQIV